MTWVGCGCDVGTGREQGREGREMVEMMTLFALSHRYPAISLCTIYEYQYLVYIIHKVAHA